MEITYRDMMKAAVDSGIAGEKTMWKSVDNVSRLLESIKAEHPELYWKFMREQYGALYNGHYGPEMSEIDVARLTYTDAAGNGHTGPHWSLDEVMSATSVMTFPPDTTPYDRYVAFNAAFADLCKHFDDDQIIQMAYDFFFNDEDWKSETKIWDYFSCMAN